MILSLCSYHKKNQFDDLENGGLQIDPDAYLIQTHNGDVGHLILEAYERLCDAVHEVHREPDRDRSCERNHKVENATCCIEVAAHSRLRLRNGDKRLCVDRVDPPEDVLPIDQGVHVPVDPAAILEDLDTVVWCLS